MHVKFLRGFVAAGVIFSCPIVVKAVELSECFATAAEFRQAFFKEKVGELDSHISVSDLNHWIQFVDKTSTTNYLWLLLERQPEKFCLRAQIIASSVHLQKVANVWEIEAVVPPLGATAGKKGRYTMKAGAAQFELVQCERFYAKGDAQKFPCEQWTD